MEKMQATKTQTLPGITPVQQMISSCSGACITSVFVTPLDVVKIRLQSQTKPFRRGSCFVYSNGLMDCLCVCSHCNNGNGGNGANSTAQAVKAAGRDVIRPWYQRPGHFTGTWDAFSKIARYEGFTALWSGLPPTLVMAVPATVVYFTTYDQLKVWLGYSEDNPSTQYLPVLAGSMARVFASSVISPLELIRTKMQSQQLSYSQLGEAVRTSVRQGGLISLMRGLGPSLLRDVPFSALYWFNYEKMKAYQLRTSGSTQLTFTQAFLGGAVAGTIAGVLTLPFDVIKTHRQIELGEAETLHKHSLAKPKKLSLLSALTRGYSKRRGLYGKVPSSTWSMIQRLYQQKGFSALFAGLVPRVIKVAPACAVMISTYEYSKAFFRKHNTQQRAATW